ncbi:helix-turn-helix domain-containing protein [Rhodococcus globerulus]|uniref:XRE family transcriptional regulator n=1 Tax=Rhodococcus globerulus TaxID=33008 RepID=A0ABU4BNT3_RHOGO|nr:XRE family transcriptional regulator [Rhodococcus globerulus]MDV6265903.1 XRE family transcriptional regulator [Rhodococcus globerulus]
MTQTTDDETELAVAIGAAVRTRREAAGLSMRALASSAGISQPFLSHLERGLSMPSMVTIYRLATVLNVAPGELMPSPLGSPSRVAIVRAGSGSPVPVSSRPDAAIGHALLFDRNTSLEVTEYRLEPEVHISEWFQSSGLAAVYLISGSLEVEVEGEGSWQLEAGDFIRHDADLRHRWLLVDKKPAHALLILNHAVAPGTQQRFGG